MGLKSFLRQEQMMNAISEARQWATFLVERESRGSGDKENAMRRVAERHEGLSYGLLWSLVYRPPKDITMSKFMSLREAYLTECVRQESALRHERELTEAKSMFAKALVRAADFVAGEEG